MGERSEIAEKIVSILKNNIDHIRYNYCIDKKDRSIMNVVYNDGGKRKNLTIFNLHFEMDGLCITVKQHENIMMSTIYINGIKESYAISNHLEYTIYNICEKLVHMGSRKTDEDILDAIKVWERDSNIKKII